MYRPHHVDTNLEQLLTNILFIASHQLYAFKIIGGDFSVRNITWSSTSVPGRYNKLFETLRICGWVQNIRKPTKKNNMLDLLFTINTDFI